MATTECGRVVAGVCAACTVYIAVGLRGHGCDRHCGCMGRQPQVKLEGRLSVMAVPVYMVRVVGVDVWGVDAVCFFE